MAKRLGQRDDGAGDARGGRLAGRGAPLRVQHALPEGAQPVGGGARGVDQCGAAGRRISPSGWRSATGRNAGAGGGGGRRRWRRSRRALFDDLNAPNALAGLFTFINRANAELDRRGSDVEALERARWAFARINGVLDIVPDRTDRRSRSSSAWVEERLVGAPSGSRAAGFCRGGPDPRRADGAGIAIEDGAGRDEVEAGPVARAGVGSAGRTLSAGRSAA